MNRSFHCCPHCRYEMRGLFPIEGDRYTALPGSVTVCPRCAGLSAFEQGTCGPGLRKVTAEELARLRERHGDFWQRLEAVIRAVRGGGSAMGG